MTAFDHYAKALRFAFEHTEKSRAAKEHNLRRRHRSQAEIDWRLRCAKDRVRLRVFKIHSRQLFKEVERMTDEAIEAVVNNIEWEDYYNYEIIPYEGTDEEFATYTLIYDGRNKEIPSGSGWAEEQDSAN